MGFANGYHIGVESKWQIHPKVVYLSFEFQFCTIHRDPVLSIKTLIHQLFQNKYFFIKMTFLKRISEGFFKNLWF